MIHNKVTQKIIPFIMVLINVSLAVSVVFLMRHVESLLNNDVEVNLTEIVTQNKEAITSRLMLNMNSLDIIAHKLTDSFKNTPYHDVKFLQNKVAEYSRDNNTTGLFVADLNGIVHYKNGKNVDISGRKYFRLAMQGIANISDKTLSRITGEDVFVFSVPLYFEKTIIGTIQKAYTPEEFHQICALSLFSSQGYMYIINSDGYVIIHTQHPDCQEKSDNYFRDLFANGNQKASQQVERDIQANRDGFVDITINGIEYFSAYTPIDSIHDWYLITSVPTNIVSSNATTVIRFFYVVLLVIVCIFASSMSYFRWFKNAQRKNLERIAFVDIVTGGNTLNKFLVDVRNTFDKFPHKQFYIMKFDIDNFKYINNYYGFAFGDQILSHIVTTMSAHLHVGEVIARVSSDHFVVLLEDAAQDRLENLLISLEIEEVGMYFSVGIYAITDMSESINLMIDKASTAAHSIKGMLNKNIVYYTVAFEQQTVKNEQMKRAVQQAIADKEFIAFYQPKVNIHTGELSGAEALVRWKKADGTFIYPDQFIPLCEQTGLITQIDMIVYEKVLKLLKMFIDENVPCVPISVNFSRVHLLNPEFIDMIVQKQREYGVPAHLIELELTESAIFDNVGSIYTFTQTMHSHGFLVAMDDFGSGYSSLNMLKDIPIDILKIDRAFLGEARDNSRRNTIFSSIVEMARNLHIKVVVEGVEYLENVELMKECGCSIAQGYYFAKPMDDKSFDAIFRKGSV